MKRKFQNFMAGRYGMDQLNQFLSIISLILVILSIFLSNLLFIIGLALMIYTYFRMFSRNISKRSAENQKFLNLKYSLATKRERSIRHREQKKIYRFFRCPSCKQKVRVPKGRGKICITCPKCKMEFYKKS